MPEYRYTVVLRTPDPQPSARASMQDDLFRRLHAIYGNILKEVSHDS